MVENGLVVTYVRDADPTTVIAAMTDEFLGKAIGLSGVNERGWEELSIVGAAQLGAWTVAVAPMSLVGVSEELMLPLSVGREVVTQARVVEAVSSFNVWKNGECVVYFDPLLRCGFGLDPKAEGPLPDGRFHVLEASFAMAANYAGA